MLEAPITLEAQLQTEREKSEFNYETDHFTQSILAREYVEPPKAGDRAPDFTLPNEKGEQVSLKELLQNGPVIMSFFKGNYCQFCDLELKVLQRTLPEFDKYGATLLGISPHTISISYQLKTEKGLSYTILSDAGNELAYRYGLRFKMQQATMDAFAGFGLSDMSPLHGDQGENTNTLPVPGTFVVGVDGIIIFAFVDSDHTKRAEPSDIIAALMTVASS